MGKLSAVGGVLKREFLEILPVTIYFLVGFNLIMFSMHLMLAQHGILYDGATKATVGALIVGKVVLIADKLPLMRLIKGRPLYRPILYRSVMYTLFVMLFHVLEIVIRESIAAGSLGSGIAVAGGEFSLPHFMFIAIWVFALFINYVTHVEAHAEYGQGGFAATLFSRGPERSG